MNEPNAMAEAYAGCSDGDWLLRSAYKLHLDELILLRCGVHIVRSARHLIIDFRSRCYIDMYALWLDGATWTTAIDTALSVARAEAGLAAAYGSKRNRVCKAGAHAAYVINTPSVVQATAHVKALAARVLETDPTKGAAVYAAVHKRSLADSADIIRDIIPLELFQEALQDE